MAKKKEPASEVQYWLSEIASAKRREKDFRKDGQEVIEIYSGEKSDQIPFNILYSNTETLLPALFSQTPRPVVQRRFKDDDQIGRAASTAAQRMLEFLCDTNVEGYETFEQSMRSATLDGLLPGRGVSVVKYDAEILEGEDIETPVVKWEQVCTESKKWDRVYFGFARKWSKVPWVAYEEYLDKEEAERMFGKEVANKINYTIGEEEDEEEEGTGTGGRDDADREYGERKTALVYQIWDKSGGKVIRYVSPQYADGFLAVQDDPLKLTGFFNCPRPIQFIEKTSDLTPTAMYKLYENQARELNNITRRIQKVVSAIKVRGVYDGSLGSELESVLNEDDNALIPTDKASSLAAEKGLDNAIWFMPFDKLITVLQQLIVAREQAQARHLRDYRRIRHHSRSVCRFGNARGAKDQGSMGHDAPQAAAKGCSSLLPGYAAHHDRGGGWKDERGNLGEGDRVAFHHFRAAHAGADGHAGRPGAGHAARSADDANPAIAVVARHPQGIAGRPSTRLSHRHRDE